MATLVVVEVVLVILVVPVGQLSLFNNNMKKTLICYIIRQEAVW